jgi:Glycosyl hydrolase family 12
LAAHRKYRKLGSLAVALCLAVAASVGGYALVSSRGAAVNLASASGASERGVTVYACLASGKLTRVSVGAVPKCPAQSALVHWAAQSGPASSPGPVPSASSSARPSPSSPPSRVPTTSPSPSPTQAHTSPTSWSWCSSAAFGQQNTPDGRFDLYNNKWNTSGNPGPQTICGNSASEWQVTSTQRAGNSAVLTYPSVQLNYNGTHGYPVSKFTSMTSSYAEAMHAVSGTDAEAAYDIWINGLNKEVMLWVDDHGQAPAGSKVATTTFSGATWALYETGDRSYMAFVRQGNASSGTVDLHAALTYLEGRGDLKAGDVLWQVNFGWEICSTAGAPETFTASNFSLASTPSS